MNIPKLKEVYGAFRRRVNIALTYGLLGPNVMEETGGFENYGFTDEAINDMRTGEGNIRGRYGNDAMNAGNFRDEREIGPGRLTQNCYEILADMMLIARAGLIQPEHMSDSGLTRWQPSDGFVKIMVTESGKVTAELSELVASLGNRDPETEKRLKHLDSYVSKHFEIPDYIET
tara:strand:+ start:3033 stop:3554 length:522 start_codon:yes stop_codon:yes gene_type:complete